MGAVISAIEDEHRDRLDGLCRHLFDLLRDPTATAADRRRAMSAILADEGLLYPDIRGDIELWLAQTVVHYEEAAECLIDDLIDDFDWDQRGVNPEISRLVGGFVARKNRRALNQGKWIAVLLLAGGLVAGLAHLVPHRQSPDARGPTAVTQQVSRPDVSACRRAARAEDARATRAAKAVCERALEANPNSLVIRSDLALVLLRRKNQRGARRLWDEVLELNPTNARALYGRGVARLAMNDAQGLTDVNKALAVDPDVGPAFKAYGFATPMGARPSAPPRIAPPPPSYPAPAAWSVVTPPKWTQLPQGDAFARAYPKLALDAGRQGKTRLRCLVAVEGILRNCIAISETPADLSFAEAALAVSNDFRITPRYVDGVPVEGASLEFTVAFALN